jgi:hypothetical protein
VPKRDALGLPLTEFERKGEREAEGELEPRGERDGDMLAVGDNVTCAEIVARLAVGDALAPPEADAQPVAVELTRDVAESEATEPLAVADSAEEADALLDAEDDAVPE